MSLQMIVEIEDAEDCITGVDKLLDEMDTETHRKLLVREEKAAIWDNLQRWNHTRDFEVTHGKADGGGGD